MYILLLYYHSYSRKNVCWGYSRRGWTKAGASNSSVEKFAW